MNQIHSAAPRQLLRIIGFYVVCIFIATLIASRQWELNFWTAFQFAVSRAGWPSGEMDGNSYYRWSLFVANIALYGAFALVLFSGLWEWFSRLFNRFFAYNHSVVCGLGWQGRAYIENLSHQTSRKVIAIDKTPDDDTRHFCELQNCRLYVGDAFDSDELLAAGVHNANYAFVCTGSQDENLSVARKILAIVRKPGARKRTNPLKLYIAISGDLRDHSFGGQILDSISVPDKKVFPLFYNADNLTARVFFHRHRVYEWAHLWRQPRVHLVFIGFTDIARELILQYARIHPYSSQSSPLFTIICRQNAVLSYQQMCERHDIFQYIESLNPDDSGSVVLPREDTSLNQGIHCGFVSCTVIPDERALLSEVLLRQVSELSQVTAVVTCHEDTEKNFDRAVQVRNLSNRYNRWRVPIFVHAPLHIGLPKVLRQSASNANPARRVIPFGSPGDHCDVQLLERMDKWAEAIHADYISQSVQTDPHAKELPANRPWHLLSAEHRIANYRAADHLVVKLSDMGYRWYGDLPGRVFHGFLTADLLPELNRLQIEIIELRHNSADLHQHDQCVAKLEKLRAADTSPIDVSREQGLLAEIRTLEESKDYLKLSGLQSQLRNVPAHLQDLSEREHTSWCVERLVMGYQYRAVRDNRLLHHWKLVPWKELKERDKSKDQRHLHVLREVVPGTECIKQNRGNRIYTKSASEVIARLPLRVAIVGGQCSTSDELELYNREIASCEFGRWLWPMVEDRWVELISPLNTGAEILLTAGIARRTRMPGCCCSKRACPHLWHKGCDHRVLIPSNLPWNDRDERNYADWKEGVKWYEMEKGYDPDNPGSSNIAWERYKEKLGTSRTKALSESEGRAEIVDLTTAGWTEAEIAARPQEDLDRELSAWIYEHADWLVVTSEDEAQAMFVDQNLSFEQMGKTSLHICQITPSDVLAQRLKGQTSVPG